MHKEEVVIGRRKILYLQIVVEYSYKGQSAKADSLWLGAIVHAGKQSLYIRIHGPRAEAGGQIAVFKKMVESAVAEREKEMAGS